MQVKQLDHVNIQTANVDAMVEWYGRVLNMPSGKRPPFDFPGAWFALGAQELHLIGDPTLSAATRVHHHYALRIDDTAAARKALEAKGWKKLRGPKQRPDGAMQLFVTDPDGYEIELMAPAKT